MSFDTFATYRDLQVHYHSEVEEYVQAISKERKVRAMSEADSRRRARSRRLFSPRCSRLNSSSFSSSLRARIVSASAAGDPYRPQVGTSIKVDTTARTGRLTCPIPRVYVTNTVSAVESLRLSQLS